MAEPDNYWIVETKDWQLRWQVWSDIVNLNEAFLTLGIKPDRYIAGFRNKDAAQEYVKRLFDI